MAKKAAKKEAGKKTGLTHRQRFFILEYLVDGNGTRAAKAAGYAQDDAAAAVQAVRLLRNAKVKAELERHQAARAERLELQGDEVLLELKKLAMSDLRALFDEKGCLLPADQWPDGHALAIQSVEVDEIVEKLGGGKLYFCNECQQALGFEHRGYTRKIKFWDKPKALELLGRNRNLFIEKVEHEHVLKLEDLVCKAQLETGPRSAGTTGPWARSEFPDLMRLS